MSPRDALTPGVWFESASTCCAGFLAKGAQGGRRGGGVHVGKRKRAFAKKELESVFRRPDDPGARRAHAARPQFSALSEARDLVLPGASALWVCSLLC